MSNSVFVVKEDEELFSPAFTYFFYFHFFYYFYFFNIILHLLTKHILQLQNLKLKESIYRYYKLDQNYIKTRKKSTAVVIRTITIDLLINRLFR